MPFRTSAPHAAGLTETCMVALGWRFISRSGGTPPMSSSAGDYRDIPPVLDGVTTSRDEATSGEDRGPDWRDASPLSSLAKEFLRNILDCVRCSVRYLLIGGIDHEPTNQPVSQSTNSSFFTNQPALHGVGSAVTARLTKYYLWSTDSPKIVSTVR